jgi:regulator of RNase E activity RraA
MPLDPAVVAELKAVSTATLTTVLLKKGLRRVAMRGPRPFGPASEARIAGRAFTLRFVPAREDLATPESWSSPRSTRAAIELMAPGDILVADAMGATGAGIFGDILCARMKKRGLAGLITDGALRDGAGVAAVGLPVWCAGLAAPASIAALTFVGWGETIGCGGVAVMAGDVVVADGDGAVVIPEAHLAAVVAEAVEQEALEAWIMKEVERGAALPGLYPAGPETRARYEAERGRK